MRKILVLAFVTFSMSLSSNAQNSIVGKWKPVFFSLQGVLKGDLTKENVDITAPLDSIVKKDKDPKTSKMMLEMVFKMLFDRLKVTIEEYTLDGKYNEINTRTGKSKTGVYTTNTDKQIIERKPTPYAEVEKINYIFSGNKLVLKTKIGSSEAKQGNLEIVYERM